MKNIYTWEYLESLIKFHYKTQESFIEEVNEELNLEISYELFRQHKSRKTKKYLNEYINLILKKQGTPTQRVLLTLVDAAIEIQNHHISDGSLVFKNKGSHFEVSKSWTNEIYESYFKNEVSLFIGEVAFSNIVKEIFKNKFLINIISKRVYKYIARKIDLVDCFTFKYINKKAYIELKYNHKVYTYPIPLDDLLEQFQLEIYDDHIHLIIH